MNDRLRLAVAVLVSLAVATGQAVCLGGCAPRERPVPVPIYIQPDGGVWVPSEQCEPDVRV